MDLNLIVISPNAISRQGLCSIVESAGFKVVASSPTREGISWDEQTDDTLVVLDRPSGESPLAVADQLSQSHGDLQVLVLADEFDFESMLDCFRKGAIGYLTKDMPCPTLITCLRLALMGERVMPSSLVDVLVRRGNNLVELSGSEGNLDQANLSQREMQVLCCLMAGNPNKVIARQLEVTEATVKVHVKAILRKLKVGNRTQAALWASSHGMAGEAMPI